MVDVSDTNFPKHSAHLLTPIFHPLISLVGGINYTTSAREFAHNIQRHLVLTVGQS